MNDTFRRPKRSDGPSIGKDIDARCGRCKRETLHTITAMVNETIAQVRCNSCSAIHKYRPTVAAKAKAASAAGTKPNRVSADMKEYRKQIADHDPDDVRKHNVFVRPVEGELIQHKKHGLGYVKSVAADKAQVLFAGGRKTIIVSR